jgi:HK97 family phage major capsid protein
MRTMNKLEGFYAELREMRQVCVDEKREPSAEERRMAKDILDKIQAIENGVEAADFFSPGPIVGRSFDPNDQGDGHYRPSNPGMAPIGGPAQDRTFRGMFYPDQPKARLSTGDFKSQEEFLEVVASGRHDPRLIKASTMIEGQPSLGGFSVPDEYSAVWLDAALPQEIIRPRCQVWPMASKTRLIPGWDDADQSAGAMFGGFAMQFLGEEGTGTYQNGKLRQIQLSAKKAAIFCQVSNGLIADGLGFEAQLQKALTGSIGYGFDRYCLRGTGAGQPLGILNSPSLITVNKEAGQDADSLTYENLCSMWARMYDPCRSRAVWIANSSIVPQLFTMGLTVGTGGAPVYVPVGGAAGAPNDALFGRPLLFSPVMSALGDLGDILLVDLTQYAFGLRKEMSLDRSQHVGFQQDLDSWLVIVRFDGQAAWANAVTPEHGLSQSWAVTLQAR